MLCNTNGGSEPPDLGFSRQRKDSFWFNLPESVFGLCLQRSNFGCKTKKSGKVMLKVTLTLSTRDVIIV